MKIMNRNGPKIEPCVDLRKFNLLFFSSMNFLKPVKYMEGLVFSLFSHFLLNYVFSFIFELYQSSAKRCSVFASVCQKYKFFAVI